MALAVGINIVGGQIALFLKLPVYLDSNRHDPYRGACGPLAGDDPQSYQRYFHGGWTVDIYSLYFRPGGDDHRICQRMDIPKISVKKAWILPAAAVITVPEQL